MIKFQVLANDDTDELRNESNFYSLCFVIIGIVTGVAWFFQVTLNSNFPKKGFKILF